MPTVLRSACVALILLCIAWPAAADAWLDGAFSQAWKGVIARDPITDWTDLFMYITTLDVNDRPLGTDIARVALSCKRGKPALEFIWSFKAAGKANLTVEYRFAGQPGRSPNVRYVNRTTQETADLGDVRTFLMDASRSDSLYVGVSSDLGGPNSATFKAKGGSTMRAKFVSFCPSAASK